MPGCSAIRLLLTWSDSQKASGPERVYNIASCFHDLYWVLNLLEVLTHEVGENQLRACFGTDR